MATDRYAPSYSREAARGFHVQCEQRLSNLDLPVASDCARPAGCRPDALTPTRKDFQCDRPSHECLCEGVLFQELHAQCSKGVVVAHAAFIFL